MGGPVYYAFYVLDMVLFIGEYSLDNYAQKIKHKSYWTSNM